MTKASQRTAQHYAADLRENKSAEGDDFGDQEARSQRAGSGESAQEPPAVDNSDKKTNSFAFPKRHPFITGGVVLLFLVIAIGVVFWWLNARQYESTDDAFINARTVTVGAEIAGRIVGVAVTDNQSVKAGDVLIRIDDSDYLAT